jgi:hypothetical protein
MLSLLIPIIYLQSVTGVRVAVQIT